MVGNFGRHRPAAFVQHRIGLHLAAVQVRHDVGGLDAGEIDLARDQVLDAGRSAAVGHELKFNADLIP
jgi:hypothetical protein